MSHKTAATASNKATTQEIRMYADWLATLPRPPETFLKQEVPDAYQSQFRKLRPTEAIQVAGTDIYDDGHSQSERHKYQLAEWAVDALDRILDTRETICPCGHSGIKNLGSHYECGFAACEKQFDRADLEVSA